MKARVNGWLITADVQRDLASNPHRAEIRATLENPSGTRFFYTSDLLPGEAVDLGAFLDALASALVSASDADDCDRCGMPCDPGEAYCPTCEEARR